MLDDEGPSMGIGAPSVLPSFSVFLVRIAPQLVDCDPFIGTPSVANG